MTSSGDAPVAAGSAAHVLGCLASLARRRGERVEAVLERFARERLLARIAAAPCATTFALAWTGLRCSWDDVRAFPRTRRGARGLPEPALGDVAQFARVLCRDRSVQDGVTFDPAGVGVRRVAAAREAPVVTIRLDAAVAGAPVQLAVDVASACSLPQETRPVITLLDGVAPRLQTEDHEAIVALDLVEYATSPFSVALLERVAEVLALGECFELRGERLARMVAEYIEQLLAKRPLDDHMAGTPIDAGLQRRWRELVDLAWPTTLPTTLRAALRALKVLGLPVLDAVAREREFSRCWHPLWGWR